MKITVLQLTFSGLDRFIAHDVLRRVEWGDIGNGANNAFRQALQLVFGIFRTVEEDGNAGGDIVGKGPAIIRLGYIILSG